MLAVVCILMGTNTLICFALYYLIKISDALERIAGKEDE